MANKTKYTRADVIKAGLTRLEADGWEGLTPKKVAAELKASTMPIYSHFPTMVQFKKALMDEAWQMMEDYALASHTGDPWVDHGVGYVLFARDKGRLFTAMHTEKLEEVQERRYRFWQTISKELTGHLLFRDMEPELAGWVRNMRSFLVYGIAVSVNTGLTPVWENEEVIRQMVALCSEVLMEGLVQKKERLFNTLDLVPKDIRERVSGVKIKEE
jgi:AcrR family transcriptional regulator